MKKRQLFPGLQSAYPSSFALPQRVAPTDTSARPVQPNEQPISAVRFGNINPIPFQQVRRL